MQMSELVLLLLGALMGGPTETQHRCQAAGDQIVIQRTPCHMAPRTTTLQTGRDSRPPPVSTPEMAAPSQRMTHDARR